MKVNFNQQPISNSYFEHPRNKAEIEILDEEIKKLLKKGVIKEAITGIEGEKFSNIFLRPNPDGSFRMILNLKKLNECVEAPHFKMESITNVLCMIEAGAWMASVDLKDAFFTIPIHSDYQKFFKFIHKRIPYKFSSMPNGYSDAMRVFTKVLKPAFSYLREIGYLSVVYVDDSYLQGETFEECLQNITVSVKLLKSLGFTIHPEKSVLKPTKKLTFLGFALISKTMTLTLTDAKKEKNIKLGEGIVNRQYITIRELAQFIGNIVATFEAVLTGPLHYRDMETLKIAKLKQHEGKFDAKIKINEESKTEIKWWIENIKGCCRNLITRLILPYIPMPATQVGVVQIESAQSMADGPLKNKNVISMSWNYWQLSFAFSLSAKIYATK